MAGSWPEDEYDVAESPLSRVDYKSQVFFNLDEPAPSVVLEEDASDTDFESLESDESGWGNGIDDTMATDIDIRVIAEGPSSSLGLITGGMLKELFEEIDRANEGRMEKIKEEGIESKAENDYEILREEILEGPEETAVSEIESTITSRTEGELRGQIEEIFRMELGEEADRAFNSAPESEIPAAMERPAEEATTAEPFIPTLPFEKTTSIPDEFPEPPPIPSRSPSRPGTSMANRRPLNDMPGAFAPAQPCDSTLSLAVAKLTGSSMSSPRSSRFFEDLGDPATTTATSIEIPQDNPLSPPLPLPLPSRKASDESSATEPLEKEKKEKKRNGSFWTCGLERLFKSRKPKELKAPVSKKLRSVSISSLAKR